MRADSDSAPGRSCGRTRAAPTIRIRCSSSSRLRFLQHLGPAVHPTRPFSTRTNQPGPVEWHFDWIAPDTDQGKIYFFAAGNAANGDFSSSGDHIFTTLDSTVFGGNTGVPIVSRNAGLTLESPLPNPTRGRPATLRFTLARAGDVRLAIFDPLGRRVRTLLAGERGAGSGQVVWDGRGESGEALAPGTYFARLAIGGEGAAVQRKITLSR